MPSVLSTLKSLLLLAPALTFAAPAGVYPRQDASSTAEPAPAPTGEAPPPGGLSDLDILNFALTLEHLESAFYRDGFAKIPQADFLALGLSEEDFNQLKGVGETEAIHVTTLLGAISGAGGVPVQPCTYNFEAAFASATTMVATARVLEAVGVSAYAGAAPLVSSPDILGAAASILTVEARHSSLIRLLSGALAVPAAFDVALGPQAVFTLAAQFITSCPEGSNLGITSFPPISLVNPEQATAGQNLQLADPAQANGALFCAFVAGSGNQFSPLADGRCVVPTGLQGEVYMMLTRSESAADADIVAGPSVLQPS